MLRYWLLISSLSFLTSCVSVGDASKPIPTITIPAQQKAHRLVVVLPGRSDDLDALKRSGVAEAIQEAWPDADVILAELAMPYYTDRIAPRRLHDEVIAPARRRGYTQIWLSGASLGGMGTLLYARDYPDDIDGAVLLAPYLGEPEILKEIQDAGGISRWNPGPPQAGDDAWQRELWRHLQSWTRKPEATRNIWVVYGDRDPLREAMPLLEPLLLKQHILIRPGGHTWRMWSPAMGEVLSKVSQETRD